MVCVNGVEINNTVVGCRRLNHKLLVDPPLPTLFATAVVMTTACGISRFGSSINPAAVVRKGFSRTTLGRRTHSLVGGSDDKSLTSIIIMQQDVSYNILLELTRRRVFGTLYSVVSPPPSNGEAI